MALLRQIKASPFLSAIDGLPPALQQRLGYSRKRTQVGRYDGHLQAYFLHDMAFTKAYNDKIERIRKTGAYEPATPLQPGFTRTSNTMSATGYVDKPTVYQSGLWAVVKGVLGFDVIHIPSGFALILGVRKDRARTVMAILHEIAPNYAYDATIGKARGFNSADDAELLTFWDAYKRAELAGTEDALLADTVAGFETRDSVRAEFEVPATVATDLDAVVAWLSKARDPRFYTSEVAAAKCWNGRTFVVRGRDNLQRVVEGLTAFAAMAENRYAAEGLRKLAEKVSTTATESTATPAARHDAPISIGFTWQSTHGERRIMDRKSMGGQDVFLVKTGDSTMRAIIPVAEIASWVAFDVKNHEQRTTVLQQQRDEEIASAQHDSWDGFTDDLPAMTRANVVAMLNTVMGYKKRDIERGHLMQQLVRDGWKVRRDAQFGHVIESPDGVFLTQRDVTKTALDYAQYLIRRDVPQRTNGSATCPPGAIVMYHGAQRWEGAPTIVEHRKGHAENGPGIYLTTSMDTAKKYAKGGGSVYRIYLDPAATFAQDVTVDVSEAREFVQSLPRLRGKADILALLTRSEERRGRMLPIEYVVNSFVNNDSASGQHGPALAAWVTAHGADALLAPQSAKEDWIVVFNPDVICKVEKLGPRDAAEYDLPKVRR